MDSRSLNIQLVLIVIAIFLVGRAAQLQLFDKSLSARADATTINKLTNYPSRGLILDRNGELMVNNFAMYDLMVTMRLMNKQMDTTKFCSLVGITKDQFKKNLDKNFRSGRYSYDVPFVFLKKIPVELYARLQESLYEFPGFFVQLRNIRGYSYPVAAHALGYINEVSPKNIKKNPSIYASGDYIGAAGLEYRYESYLRGEKGARYLLRDNRGRTVGKYKDGIKDTFALSGKDLWTTLDVELQAYAEELMQNKSGSIVAIEPQTGEILCMVSAPTYDPNLLTLTQNRGNVFSKMYNDEAKPLFDRTVMAKYPPGSIFKTVVALAGLQEGVIDPDRGVKCNSGYYYGGRTYKCHSHARLNSVEAAIAHSCNAYFFSKFRDVVDNLGYSTPQKGLGKFNEYVYQFGLGQKLGIDYPSESKGNIPTPAYYDKLYPKKLGSWRSPTIMSVGIGQGELQLTTIQMANLAAAIANKGYWYRPHLAKKFHDGTPIPKQFREKQKVSIDRQHFNRVIDGMAQCVNYGTARSCAIPGIQVCGKTGTSQNPHGDDHSVFFAFAPKDNPKIAIAVYVENGTWGSTYAAPMASLCIEKYINREIKENRLYLEKRMHEADLMHKYYKTQKVAKVQASLPKPKRDTLPKPNQPLDAPQGAILSNTTKKIQFISVICSISLFRMFKIGK